MKKIIDSIAKNLLGIDTLKTQNSDSLDFHDLAVWDIEKALETAFKDGSESKKNLKWSTKFPTKEGYYWFWGYRYGKISCGQKCEPEWMILRVARCSNGFMYIANGQFVYEKEVEEAHFAPFEVPEFPQIKS